MKYKGESKNHLWCYYSWLVTATICISLSISYPKHKYANIDYIHVCPITMRLDCMNCTPRISSDFYHWFHQSSHLNLHWNFIIGLSKKFQKHTVNIPQSFSLVNKQLSATWYTGKTITLGIRRSELFPCVCQLRALCNLAGSLCVSVFPSVKWEW